MRIYAYYKKEDAESGSGPLREAIEKAPKKKGLYILEMDDQKKFIGIAKEGLRERFIELYSGLKLKEDPMAIDVYENRDKIFVHWVEEHSDEDANEYIEKFKKTYNPDWM